MWTLNRRLIGDFLLNSFYLTMHMYVDYGNNQLCILTDSFVVLNICLFSLYQILQQKESVFKSGCSVLSYLLRKYRVNQEQLGVDKDQRLNRRKNPDEEVPTENRRKQETCQQWQASNKTRKRDLMEFTKTLLLSNKVVLMSHLAF